MSNRARFLVFMLVAAIAMASMSGCGGNDSATDTVDSELVAIDISPGVNTVVIHGTTPATAEYQAIGTFADGSSADITDQVVFSLENPRLGLFDGATLTTGTSAGGRTLVYAWLGDVMGIANLTLRLEQRYPDPNAGSDIPTDPGARFEGPEDEERAPSLVYPNDGVMVPPNLRKLEFHFYPGQDNTLFEIAYSSDTTDVKVYTRCVVPRGGGCIYTPDEMVWSWIAESNRGTDELRVTVRGADDQGTAVGVSEPISVAFSQDDIQGAVYYWTTSETQDSATAIMRFDFASTQTQAERFIGTEMTGDYCVGCHALSRSGDKLLTSSNSSFNAYVLLVDVGTRMPLQPFNSTPRSAFSAWNPDGSRYVGVFADEQESGFISYDLNVFDGNSGELIEVIDVGGSEEHPSTHPDWSPDGQRIAYTHIGHVPSFRLDNGTLALAEQPSLRMVTRNEDGSWSQPEELTASVEGQGTFYPAFSPEGDLLVFNESVCSDGDNGRDCDAYDDPGAALYVMVPEPGAPAIELSAANAPGVTDESTVVQSSYPKWAPFTFQRSGEFGSRLHWLTFSSDRNYGLREPSESRTLIWMAAVDPDAALQGRDPSFAAFALPFQDLTTDNHTAQWTERVITVE